MWPLGIAGSASCLPARERRIVSRCLHCREQNLAPARTSTSEPPHSAQAKCPRSRGCMAHSVRIASASEKSSSEPVARAAEGSLDSGIRVAARAAFTASGVDSHGCRVGLVTAWGFLYAVPWRAWALAGSWSRRCGRGSALLRLYSLVGAPSCSGSAGVRLALAASVKRLAGLSAHLLCVIRVRGVPLLRLALVVVLLAGDLLGGHVHAVVTLHPSAWLA